MRHDESQGVREDSGFTLMELIVAMMIIGGVLLGLAAIQTSALVSTQQTRQRTLGTAVTNQVMEQLRALPWNTLNKGLRSGFATAAGGDPNVAGSRLRPVADASIDEPLVQSTDQETTKAPLSGGGGSNLTRTRNPEAPGVVFTSRAYVTRSATGTDVLTLTVITTWRPSHRADERHVVVRSRAYAPDGGCGDAANQPYLGACQALFAANAGASGAEITVTAAFGGHASDPAVDASTPILPGSATTVASLRAGTAGVGLSAQQSTSVESSALHAGGALTTGGDPAPSVTTGGQKSDTQASNDVGSAGAAPVDPAAVTSFGTAGSLALGSGAMTMSLTPGSNGRATVDATTVRACATGIAAGQPCASSALVAAAPTSASLTVGTSTFVLSSISPSTSSSFGGRFSSAPGAAAIGCTTLTGPGCAAAGVTRSLGTVQVGSGPWSGGAASSGLVQVTSYTDATRVERGLSQRTNPAVTSRSGTVRYWNGSSYTTLSLSGTTNTTVSTGSVTWTGGGRTITATGTVSVTPSSSLATAADPAGCTGEGCSISAETGAVSLAVHYRIETASGVSAFVVTTSLGAARASAGFKAAPGA
ncbi:prepilin-type N-terminal cleavage/methylation domain-containing protein [Cellulomonas gilvus]|uniref:Prepilin-type N-terminal cleavage/methylation domain-containing protein n=1 Tax=Cellulomonas gilvus (strain ATCC 13127 / NRRL B-14078) TaxID=593907 RepID=F8A6V9_CELGA|nr:prepilin-type N-terminal cleavage/methylation domain-containing protein [Cellulomonas gilvus]AEI12313.1 hypothetical protein Celgi_1806 [Cellulomonas gilvus ATCC 13127]